MSIARRSRYGRKSKREYNRSPNAIGVETNFARSAISSGWVGSSGSVVDPHVSYTIISQGP